MGFNSLESEGAARGRELLKRAIIPEATMFYYISPDWSKLPWKPFRSC